MQSLAMTTSSIVQYHHKSKLKGPLLECMVNCGLRPNIQIAESDLRAELSNGEIYYLYPVEEKVAGFVSGGPRLSHDRRGEFELFHIGVDQSVQAKGIGSQLFSHLIVQAKAHYSGKDSHLRKFRLTTALTNTNAHSFYEHQGMVVTGFSEHRFGNQKQELEYALLFDEHGNIRTDITDRKKGIVDLLTET